VDRLTPDAEARQSDCITPQQFASSPHEVGNERPRAKPSFYKPELDTLRFFAFLGVFVVHIANYSTADLVERHVPVWAAEIGLSFIHAGMYGVDLFFVLSAYLITELLLREKAAIGSVDVRAFYVRRILRIWPLYYLFVPLAALIPALNPNHQLGLRYVLPFLCLMGNWSFIVFGWPDSVVVPLWSVSVEEQFYLLWPPVVSRLSRRHIAITAVCLIVVANISRLVGVAMHESTQQLWANTFAHLDSIAAGVLLAILLDGEVRCSRYWGRIALFAAGMFGLAARGHFVANTAVERLSLAGTLIGYPAVVLACTAILVAFMGLPARLPVFQYLGKISYGLYVYHMVSILITDRLMPDSSGVGHAGIRAIVALGITVALSAASYAIVEKPFLNLKRRFTYVQSRPA
jgi:peptidoglycan/LPS O-acetylase OafA/YrhL